jgi:hypothetical protein
VYLNQRRLLLLLLPGCLGALPALAQVDPVPRELVQIGYNAFFEGHPPLAAYMFYLKNTPDFPKTNLTLRLAVAPTYIDTELGIRGVLGESTDMGIGLAGGGFADSYDEIRDGTFIPKESFIGHRAENSLSLYHCFNPGALIPLNGVLRGTGNYTFYARDNSTADSAEFKLPPDHGTFTVRTGLRWGGKEPMLYPSLAMELSVWYEGEFRTTSGTYGDLSPTTPSGDREMVPSSHLFWEQALLAYTFPKSQQSFFLSVTAGTSINADRFSTFRLGGMLPLISEFPLTLAGYYFQEISANEFVLGTANYIAPLDKSKRWNASIGATTAGVNYLKGLAQPGHWLSGVGGGILYSAPSLKVLVGYSYGIDAIRSDGRGSHSVGILMQMDLEHAKSLMGAKPGYWRGLQSVFSVFTN